MQGLNFNIVSPTLLQLKSLMNMTLPEVSAVFTARSSGYLMSAPISAWLVTPSNRNTVLLVHVVLMAVTIFVLPAASQLVWPRAFFYTAAALNGVAAGGMESLVNVWMLHVWGTKSTPYMQALHFAFAIGCAMAPVLASLFLTQPILLLYAYGFVAIAVTISAFLMVTVFVRGEAVEIERGKGKEKPGCDMHDSGKGIQSSTKVKGSRDSVILLSSLFLVTYSGTAIIYNQFLPTHLQTAYALPPETASYIHSTLNYVSSGARLLSIFVAIRCPPQYLLFFNLSMFDAGSILLLLFAGQRDAIVWTGNIIIGLGMGGCTGPLFSFLNQKRLVTNVTGSVFVFSNGLTSVFVPLVVGNIMSTQPAFLVTFNVVCITIAICIFSAIYLLSVRQSKSAADEPE